MLTGRAIWGLWKKLLYSNSNLSIMDLDKCASRSSVQTSKIKKIPAYSLLPYAESIAWQLWFFVQICFLFNPSLKFKSPISLLDSTIKKSWLIKCSQAKSSEDFEKNALFKFQFFYYGSWQIWKPLNRVKTSKIKKIQAYSLLLLTENIAWQLWFVVQFCFLFNSSLKFKSPISLLDSTIKKSWLIKCSQAEPSEDFEKNCSIQIPICLLWILTNVQAAHQFKLRK